MAFSSVLPFLLPTHSADCAVHLLLSHSRALLVSSALFHPFTALILPFFFFFMQTYIMFFLGYGHQEIYTILYIIV